MASSLVEVSVFKFWKRRRKSLTARMHERQKDRSRFSIFRRKKKGDGDVWIYGVYYYYCRYWHYGFDRREIHLAVSIGDQ